MIILIYFFLPFFGKKIFKKKRVLKFINDLSLNIKNNTNIEKVNGRHGVNETRNVLLEKQIELKFPKLEIKNGSEHYDTLILNHLNKHGVQKEEFEVWKKKVFT
jgi:hypothetical protein